MTDTYEHLTDAERTADARTLRRALELSRSKEKQWRDTAQRWRRDAQYVIDQLDDARAWSALWKRTAKVNYAGWNKCYNALVKALEDGASVGRLDALEAERDAIIHALDDAGFQQRDRPALERVQDAIKLNDMLCAANSYYIEQLEELEAGRDALRAAVEAVEWVETPVDDEGINQCPWCLYYECLGHHAPDCQRQRALGLGG
jgi:hypothetical protein